MKQVGKLSKRIIDALQLPYVADTPIFIGDSNINHMQNNHPYDFDIYFEEIPNIIASPDYVSLNKDKSIEYVKEYKRDNNFVKVAVRISTTGKLFARTLYTLNTKRVMDYIAKGTLKKID